MTLLKDFVKILLGASICAVGISLFLAPNAIITGGASGLGIALYVAFSVPVSVTILAVNAVLFLIGYRYLGKKTFLKTVAATVVLSVLTEVFSTFEKFTDDILLSSIFGGLLLGVGTGMVISTGASTGGSDFAAVLIRRKINHVPIALIILIIDISIVALSFAINDNPTIVLYSVLGLFAAIKTVDFVVEGINFSKLVFIISDENKNISKFIISEMNRGVTSLYANGVYTDKDKSVLMCAVSARQFPLLKKYVLTQDKNAFVILSDARSVFGKGFKME